MSRLIGVIVLFGAIFTGGDSFAVEQSGASPSKIPYKTDDPVLEKHEERVGWGVISLLLLGGGAIYFIRRKIPSLISSTLEADSHLKILKHSKLNPRTALYVVEFNQRKLLIGQSGDNLVCLADTEIPQSINQGQTDV